MTPPTPPTPTRAVPHRPRSSRPSALGAGALLVALLLAPAGEAQAQRRTFFGVTAGATVGDIYGGGINTGSGWGGTAGLTAGMRSWSYMVTQLEANWVQKGGEGLRLDYVEIPFLIGGVAQTASGRSARFYTGIGVSFPIGCSADSSSSFGCELDRKTEWTWPVGFQLGQWVETGRVLAIDVRYSFAFTDAFKNLYTHNRSWQFRLIVGRQR